MFIPPIQIWTGAVRDNIVCDFRGKLLQMAIAVLLSGACSPIAPLSQEPVLPAPSSIPGGIYSGTLNEVFSGTQNGVFGSQTQSRPFSVAFDADGRRLDDSGMPFMINQRYSDRNGIADISSRCVSILVDANRIILNFQVTSNADVGVDSITLSGFETHTLHYDESTSSIRYSRFTELAGVSSSGAVVTGQVLGDATLSRN